MRSEVEGVSPVVATVLLIGLTIVGVSILAAYLSSIPMPSQPAAARLRFENLVDGASGFVIVHMGGKSIQNAFDGARWINMKAILNGEPVPLENAEYNGGPVPDVVDFKFADRLRLQVGLSSGDEITVVCVSTGETLQYAIVG
ncbi:MAG: type IV pilin N-terminal domain-containing protein [Candidatus Hadarchaeales archaeon]